MEFERVLGCFFVLLMGFLSSSDAYKFYVGGKDGWVVAPSENYNHWAERMRFQVNDTLFFKYNKGSNSVLIVSKDDYYSCNTKNPDKSFTEGDSIFTFDHSGPYFFISGNADNCNKGQKLIVVVMAIRNKTHHHAPPSPSPVSSPPASPPSVSLPVESPTSPAPVQPPESSNTPSDLDAPSPSPFRSGSSALGFSVGSILGYSVGVGLVFGSIFGIV